MPVDETANDTHAHPLVRKHPHNRLVVWDTYSVLHRATGGYDSQERLMHRITLRSISSAHQS